MQRIRLRFAPLALMVLLTTWGCENSNTLVLEPNPAVRILIDDSPCPLLQMCRQCQLAFEAYDKNSQPTLFPSLDWSSLDPDIATVDDTGEVSGWTQGSVTIAVEVLETGATDDIEISVSSPPRGVTCTPPGGLAPAAPR